MPGDSAVSGFPWKRSAFDVSSTQPQHSRAGPLQNCDGQSQPRDIHAAQNVAFFDRGFRLRLRASWFAFFHLDLVFQGSFCGCLV